MTETRHFKNTVLSKSGTRCPQVRHREGHHHARGRSSRQGRPSTRDPSGWDASKVADTSRNVLWVVGRHCHGRHLRVPTDNQRRLFRWPSTKTYAKGTFSSAEDVSFHVRMRHFVQGKHVSGWDTPSRTTMAFNVRIPPVPSTAIFPSGRMSSVQDVTETFPWAMTLVRRRGLVRVGHLLNDQNPSGVF